MPSDDPYLVRNANFGETEGITWNQLARSFLQSVFGSLSVDLIGARMKRKTTTTTTSVSQ